MNYGYFDDKKREYVIERPDTPAPWVNYLGSPAYGAIISNNAGGYSFARSAEYCAMYSITLTSPDVTSIFTTGTRKITGRPPGSLWERICPSTKASAATVWAIHR